MKSILAIMLLIITLPANASEDEHNDAFCESVGGKREVRYHYRAGSYVRVDCETSGYVWEGGLDKASSLDSIQQALFASFISGKQPAVVIYDRDGKEGAYEYRIRRACEKANIFFINWRKP